MNVDFDFQKQTLKKTIMDFDKGHISDLKPQGFYDMVETRQRDLLDQADETMELRSRQFSSKSSNQDNESTVSSLNEKDIFNLFQVPRPPWDDFSQLSAMLLVVRNERLRKAQSLLM